MLNTPFSNPQNRLLTLLPAPSRRHLFAELESVDLPKNFRMASAGEQISHVYFMNSGIGSIIITSAEGRSSEAGVVGDDGFSPAAIAVGVKTSPYDVIVQCSGEGYRMTASAFCNVMERDKLVAKMALQYFHVFGLQVAYTAHSNALDSIEVRLARWLLMCHDRVWGDDIELTHAYLSIMLAVRRPSVTTALHVLEGDGLLRSTRGLVVIRNRKGLEDFVGSSYGAPEHEYRTLIEREMSEGETTEVRPVRFSKSVQIPLPEA